MSCQLRDLRVVPTRITARSMDLELSTQRIEESVVLKALSLISRLTMGKSGKWMLVFHRPTPPIVMSMSFNLCSCQCQPEMGAHANHFQVGDFHQDVLQTAITDCCGKAKLWFSVEGPTGQMLGHCHFHCHADQRMACLGEIVGKEGVHGPKLAGTCHWCTSGQE